MSVDCWGVWVMEVLEGVCQYLLDMGLVARVVVPFGGDACYVHVWTSKYIIIVVGGGSVVRVIGGGVDVDLVVPGSLDRVFRAVVG